MTWLRRLWHWVEHRLGWNTGRCETWWQDGRLWNGFRCSGCGVVSHAEPTPRHLTHPEEFP